MGDVGIRIKRLEQLRIKCFPLVKIWKNVSVGEFLIKEKEKTRKKVKEKEKGSVVHKNSLWIHVAIC